MPSSPGPTDYKRTLQRFFYRGISLQPQDALAEGKLAWARNIRSYEPGTITVRYGLDLLTETPFDDVPHSIFRLNDATPYGEVGAPSRRIIGAGTGLYGGSPGTDTYSLIDPVAYSGNPLTAITAEPVNSPRPFLYVADSVRMRKVNSSFNDMPIGLAQPTVPPSATLDAPEYTFLESVGIGTWTTYGPNMTPGAPTPAPVVDRVNTTVTELLYDSGSTGMASVGLADFNNVTAGMSIDIGASPETVVVHTLHPPVAPTTIEAILYDSGTTGLCTIQPAGSFSVGQIEATVREEVAHRYRNLSQSLPPRVTITRTVDFPVDSLILLGGTELVRIQSIAVGPDDVLSFRCFTFGTFAAGAAITGLPSFRAYFNTTKSVGDPAVAQAIQATCTPATTTDAEVGGFQVPIASRNWASVGTVASSPDDIIRVGIKISHLAFTESVRLVLDLSPTGPEFLRDYLFYEWRASDLITAIQTAGETATGLVADAQQAAVDRGLTTGLYHDQYGQAPDAVRTALLDASSGIRGIFGVPDEEANIQTNIAETSPVSTGSAISRQLSLGDDSWMTLECRIRDLTRVGTDTTLTLGAILNAAIYAQFLGTTDTITIEASDCYLTGGYGPDVGNILPPYVYRYSYRSNITGERSNPSPPMRAGVTPRRGKVLLQVTPSQDPQADLIDLWRFGGALARWEYVLTVPNETASPAIIDLADTMADGQIDGGQRIWSDRFQPWPVADLPRSGTCNVAGTSIEWVSGDQFDINWSADSLININGRATQLYRSPTSTTRLEVVDNCGAGTAVPFSLPSPTLLAQPLPIVFGGPLNNAWFHFACGDAINPGILYWSHGNDPDAASDRNTLVVTSASEPLMNGWVDDGIPYVFSSQKLLRIIPAFGSTSDFITQETNCTVGLWSPWFFTPDPDGGAYFGRPDGIYHTRGGADPVCITDPDLTILFSQDGAVAEAIRNMNPIDFSQPTRLRLSMVGKLLYFDYLDTTGKGCTLVYDTTYQGWTPDYYLENGSPLDPVGVTVRLSEPGEAVYDHIFLAEDGNLYQYTFDKITDLLDTIFWAIWTPWAHGEDPRAQKQWGDAILDFNPGGSEDGISVTPVIDNGNVPLIERIVGTGGTLRATYTIELGAIGETLGYGVLSRNCGLLIEGGLQACDIQRPIFYLWEPSFLWKGTPVARRTTDWEDLGYKGAKFIQGVVIRANTFAEDKCVAVEYDGPNTGPQLHLPVLTLNHDGEQSKAYPLSSDGWTPFVAELVRLRGYDDEDWTLLDWRFVWEPAPEAATEWSTQDTTFDLPGFLHVHDGVMAYAATAPVTLTVWHDLIPVDYLLADTGGIYQRNYVLFEALKGKAARFTWRSDEPFRLFKRDCSVRVQGWSIPGGYSVQSPFGGPHRADGAGI